MGNERKENWEYIFRFMLMYFSLKLENNHHLFLSGFVLDKKNNCE